MKKKTKKRNPNDTTFRNINALKKQIAKLTKRVADVEEFLKGVIAASQNQEVKRVYELRLGKKIKK